MKIACKMKQKMIDFWLIVLNMVHRELKFIGYVMLIEFCYDSNCFIDWICMKIDFFFCLGEDYMNKFIYCHGNYTCNL
jgi:hypothetical protein